VGNSPLKRNVQGRNIDNGLEKLEDIVEFLKKNGIIL
jgi:hypothetical protein